MHAYWETYTVYCIGNKLLLNLIDSSDKQQKLLLSNGVTLSTAVHIPLHLLHLVGHTVCFLTLMWQTAQVPEWQEHKSLVYQSSYNNPSYSCILIGSRLWSIRGQTHDWRLLIISKFFPLCFTMVESFENLDNILHDCPAKDKVQESLVQALNRYQKHGV